MMRRLAIILGLLLCVTSANAAGLLKQSSATHKLIWNMVQEDGFTPWTGGTATVLLTKDGAAYGAPAGAVSELANGTYVVAGNATDTNTLGELTLYATGAGALPAKKTWTVVAFDPDAVAVGAAVTGSAMTLAGGAIVAGTFGAGAIDAAAIKDAAIDNATFAADVGSTALISNPVAQAAATGTWESLTAGHTTVNTFGALVNTNLNATVSSRSTYAGGAADANIGAVKTVTDRLDTGLVADGLIWQWTANALELAPAGGGGGGWDDAVAGHIVPGSFGLLVGTNLDAKVSLAGGGTPAAVADAVWDEPQADHLAPLSAGRFYNDILRRILALVVSR